MKHVSVLAGITLLCAILPSCATGMTSVIDGYDAPLLPPLAMGGDKPVEAAISMGVGESFAASFFLPLINGTGTASFARAEALMQWAPGLGKKGVCGVASLGAWAGYAFGETASANWPTGTDALSYGLSATLRLGAALVNHDDYVYEPSLQVRYAYEDGPYFHQRVALAAIERTSDFDMLYINLKESHHSWQAALSPLDLSFRVPIGDFRILLDFGWNDRWYPLAVSLWSAQYESSEDFRNAILASFMPTNYTQALSFQFRNSGWYIGIGTGLVSNYAIFITEGISLSAGYCW